MSAYNYTFEAYIPTLETEIHSSDISVALDNVIAIDDVVIITFKRDLSDVELLMLTTIVDNHEPTSDLSEPALKVEFSKKSEGDGIPYVYATSKPLDHYVCFQGADDIEPSESDDGIGRGNKLTFKLLSTDRQVIKDFTFNETIFLKDGHIICNDCPFGASICVDIIHPVYGLIQTFARNVPIYKNAFMELNTEDRAELPKGLIVRITANNSGETNVEDPPATFSFSARLEIYRPRKDI